MEFSDHHDLQRIYLRTVLFFTCNHNMQILVRWTCLLYPFPTFKWID